MRNISKSDTKKIKIKKYGYPLVHLVPITPHPLPRNTHFLIFVTTKRKKRKKENKEKKNIEPSFVEVNANY